MPLPILILLWLGMLASSGTAEAQRPTLTHVWTAGQGPETWFESVGDIVAGPNDSWIVADRRQGRIVVLDNNGTAIRWMGRSGHGPGEFVTVGGLRIAGDTIFGFDGVQRRRTVFMIDGTHIRTQAIRQEPDFAIGRAFPLGTEKELLVSIPRFMRGDPDHDPHQTVLVRWKDGAVDTLSRIRASGAMWGNRDGEVPWGLAESGFGDGGAWAILNDSTVAVADGYEGRVAWIRVARKQTSVYREIDLGVRGPPVTDEDLEALKNRLRDDLSSLPPRVTIRAPERWSVASALIPSGDGALWVRTRLDTGEGETWIVLGGADERREVQLPAGFQLRSVSKDLLVGRSSSSMDEPLVSAYRLGS